MRVLNINEAILVDLKQNIIARYIAQHDMSAFVERRISSIADQLKNNPLPIQLQTNNPATRQLFEDCGLLDRNGLIVSGLLYDCIEVKHLREVLADQFMDPEWPVVFASIAQNHARPKIEDKFVLFEASNDGAIVCTFALNQEIIQYRVVNANIAKSILDNDRSKMSDVFFAVMPAPSLDEDIARYYLIKDMLDRGYLHHVSQAPVQIDSPMVREHTKIEINGVTLEFIASGQQLYVYKHDLDLAGDPIVVCLSNTKLSDAEYYALVSAMRGMSIVQAQMVANTVAASNYELAFKLYRDIPSIDLYQIVSKFANDSVPNRFIDLINELSEQDRYILIISILYGQKYIPTEFALKIIARELAVNLNNPHAKIFYNLKSIMSRTSSGVWTPKEQYILDLSKILLNYNIHDQQGLVEALKVSIIVESEHLFQAVLSKILSFNNATELLAKVYAPGLYCPAPETIEKFYTSVVSKSGTRVFDKIIQNMYLNGDMEPYSTWWAGKAHTSSSHNNYRQ